MQARDGLAVLGALDWTPIVVALITLSGVIFNAALGAVVLWHLHTPSGTRIGKQVEQGLHTGLANNYEIKTIGSRMDTANGDAEPPPDVRAVPDV